jgi:hypothetical protein
MIYLYLVTEVFKSDIGIQKIIKNRNIIETKSWNRKKLRDKFENRNSIEHKKLEEKVVGGQILMNFVGMKKFP